MREEDAIAVTNRRGLLTGSLSALALACAPSASGKATTRELSARRPRTNGIIDVHAHAILPIWLDALARATGQSRENLRVSGAVLPDWSPEKQVALMDAQGIATSILSWPGATGFLKGEPARDLARAMNEEFARIIARYPGRFGAFAAIPTDDLQAAAAESAYALDVLHLDGIATTSNIEGYYLGDSRFDDWFAEMDRRKARLFVHPAPPANNTGLRLNINVSIMEFMFDSTRMAANLVLSGRKKRFADIAIICTHGGGTMPFLVNRIAALAPYLDTAPDQKTPSSAEILAGVSTFYYDLAAATSRSQLEAVLMTLPSSRVMMGFDSPMMPATSIDAAIQKLDAFPLSAKQHQDIVRGTALTLFPRFAT